MGTLPRDLMRSVGFLTRMPVHSRWFEGENISLAQCSRAFPLAGVVAALPSVIVLGLGTILDLPVLLTALAAVITLVVISGGLHEDGLADVSDGFYGGNSVERRLEIMKDSRIGSYGAMALVFAALARTIALAAFLQTGFLIASAGLVSAVVVGKMTLVWHWSELPCARVGGVADQAGVPTEDANAFAMIVGFLIAIVLVLAARGITPFVLGAALAGLASVAFRSLSLGKIGGHTGDTLGAAALIGEIVFLTGLASGL